MSSSILDTAKSDAVIVAKRIALSKLINLTNKIIVEAIQTNPKIKPKAKRDLLQFLETDRGVAAVKFVAGLIVPQIKFVIHPDYHDTIDSVAQELRVQGEFVAATNIIDFITEQFNKFSIEHIFGQRVRVELEPETKLLNSGIPAHIQEQKYNNQTVN
jgi:hypothetical protein